MPPPPPYRTPGSLGPHPLQVRHQHGHLLGLVLRVRPAHEYTLARHRTVVVFVLEDQNIYFTESSRKIIVVFVHGDISGEKGGSVRGGGYLAYTCTVPGSARVGVFCPVFCV